MKKRKCWIEWHVDHINENNEVHIDKLNSRGTDGFIEPILTCAPWLHCSSNGWMDGGMRDPSCSTEVEV